MSGTNGHSNDDLPRANRYTGRQEVLDGATRAVLQERNATYGDPDQDFIRIAAMVSAMWADNLKRPLTGEEVAQFQICLKLSRLQHSPTHLDSWADIAGYAACGYETAALAQLRRIVADDKHDAEVVSEMHPVTKGQHPDVIHPLISPRFSAPTYTCLCGRIFLTEEGYIQHKLQNEH